MKTEEQIIESIFDFSRMFREIMMNSCKTHSLTMLQLHVLLIMKNGKDLKVKDVADHLMIAMPTATNLLDKLVEQELVTRKVDENDRRNVLLSLTDKGRELLIKGKKMRNDVMNKVLSHLNDEEKISLLNILNKLQSNYEK